MECSIQQVDDNGKMIWPLTCTYDMGWQKHAWGKTTIANQDMACLLVVIPARS